MIDSTVYLNYTKFALMIAYPLTAHTLTEDESYSK